MRIHFAAPNYIEPWDYRNVFDIGIGGSETSHVEMATRLARRHEVISYTKLPEDCPDKNFMGVQWKDLSEMDLSQDGLWIIYRRPGLGKECFPSANRKYWLVCQDVWYNDWNKDHVKAFDIIMGLCPRHMRYLADNDPENKDRYRLSSNGINLERVLETEKLGLQRNPKRLIWASSPDRGLAELLKIFERAREQIDIELHVFYGMDNINKLCGGDRTKYPWAPIWKVYEKAINTEGVVWRGRIGQKQLAQEWMQAGIWCYPTWFCVAGDTPIDCPRDYSKYPRGIPIKDLVGKSGFPTWCFDEKEEIFKLAPVEWVRKTRTNAEVWRVEFDDGTFIKATPDHKFLMRKDLSWKQLKDLQPGDSIMSLAKHMQVQVGVRGGRGSWPTEHRLVAEYNTGKSIPRGMHVDHIDGNCWNNNPDNLQILTKQEHAKKTFSGRTGTARLKQISGTRLKDWWDNLSEEEKSQHGSASSKKFWLSLTLEERQNFINKRKEKIKIAKEKKRQEQFTNHKVVRVVFDGYEDVYCMKINGPSNFIANGVVVHNCETSCISCMEAQVYGAIAISSPIWATGYNIRNGIFIEGDSNEPLTITRYVDAVVRIANDTNSQEIFRQEMMRRARQDFNWDNFVTQWETWMKEYETM